jgi:hypothetical protein
MRQCCLPAVHGRARRSVERCMSLHDVLYIVAHHALLLSPAARNCRRKPNGLITEPCFYVPPTASLGCLRFGRLRFGRLRFGHSHLARGTPRWVETMGRPAIVAHAGFENRYAPWTHQATAHMYNVQHVPLRVHGAALSIQHAMHTFWQIVIIARNCAA